MLRTSKTFKIVFDNAGWAYLFNRHYAHKYEDGRQLAADVICLLAGGDARQWGGDDKELREMMLRDTEIIYVSSYNLPELAIDLAEGDVIVDGDTVYRRAYDEHLEVSCNAESDFLRAVSGW